MKISPLRLDALPVTRRGLTEFTFSRYAVPWITGYDGLALFMDADMIVRGPIDDLFNFVKDQEAAGNGADVHVVKNRERFEWTSLMMFECWRCKQLTPEVIQEGQVNTLEWATKIGELPANWNHCVGYDRRNPDARVVHYTQGVPYFREVRNCEFYQEWWEEFHSSQSTCSWIELMGHSRHCGPVLDRLKETAAQEEART